MARARGDDLTGPDRLLQVITKTVLEPALEEELTEHLGHERHRSPTLPALLSARGARRLGAGSGAGGGLSRLLGDVRR